MALKGTWRASKLMGLDVYNQNNEKLGDVNEIILDKNGKVAAVVIGVGGFLGWESMTSLSRWTSSSSLRNPCVRVPLLLRQIHPVMPQPAPPPRRQTRTDAAARAANTNDWTPDHAVMNGTKDQLKAMPQFKYSDYN